MGIAVRKITLMPMGDKAEIERVYRYIRNGQEVQSLMMNKCMGAMYVARLNNIGKEEWKKLKRLHSRVPSSSKGSAYSFDMDKYPTGLPIAGSVPMKCEQKLKKAMKDGLMYGRVQVPNFKPTTPLYVPKTAISVAGTLTQSNGSPINTGLYHGYDSPGKLSAALEKEVRPDIHIRFVNNIYFDLVLGNPHKSRELRSVIERIFAGEYKVCDSSIGIEDKKIILNLTIEMPEKEREDLDENTVVGVNLGLSVPAACALNNNLYAREYIGSYDDFTKNRVKIQRERRLITSRLKDTAGGHGRKKKLRHLEQIKISERNFTKTYNHKISAEVIKFALKYHAAYINLEDLKGFSKQEKNSFVLRNWSYYELQTMIQYKAAAEGIKVRFVEPAYISQTCSICGGAGTVKDHIFTCSDPDCKIHYLYQVKIRSDFNAARNVAQKEEFVEPEKPKKRAKSADNEQETADE